MYLTVQTLLNDPNIVKAVIDRVIALRLDTIYWKNIWTSRKREAECSRLIWVR